MFYEYIIKHHLQLYLIIGLMKYIRNLLSFYYYFIIVNVLVVIVMSLWIYFIIIVNILIDL